MATKKTTSTETTAIATEAVEQEANKITVNPSKIIDVPDAIHEGNDSKIVQRATHLGTNQLKKAYREEAIDVAFEPSVTDTSFYQDTAAQVADFMRSGQNLLQTRRGQYDFEDGKDTGEPIPISRDIGAELAEVAQAAKIEEARLQNLVEARRAEATNRKDKETYRQAIFNALAGVSRPSEGKSDTEPSSTAE